MTGRFYQPFDSEAKVQVNRQRAAGYTRGVSPFRRLLDYVLRYRRAFLVGLLCVVIYAERGAGVADGPPICRRRSDARCHRGPS